ncbi:Uncharacterized protein HZ326_10422 [Fusarium oxysporum f. sp. albedinis]|nr:Uncharacterized protein HZ326_10422 [Fusarium oxysporum f. sp. albedinis]
MSFFVCMYLCQALESTKCLSKRNCFDDNDSQFVTTWGGNNDSLAQVALQASRTQIVTQSKCEQTGRARKDSCMQESK